MIGFYSEHRGFWTPERKRSLYLGILLFILSVIIQITLGRYSAHRAVSANSVHDIFLDNLPVVNLDFVIVAGDVALWVFAWILLTKRPRYLIFGTKAIALFNISRAFFISLTHIGAYPGALSPGPGDFGYGVYRLFTFQGNYFFSGHTGFPFLLALVFWDNKRLRWFFLAITVIFGASVLLAHVHYAIDVFAAPFIVYGMYAVTKKVFSRDYAIMETA